MNVLKRMRSMQVLKILLWVVVLSFLLAMFTVWGGGQEAEKGGHSLLGRDYAVKVGSDILPPGAYRLQYRFYAERVRSMLGKNFKRSFLKGAPQRIASQLADQLILGQMAKKYGLRVSDQEVAQTIERLYHFKNPKTEYPVMLSRLGVSAQDYQAMVRNELLVQKLQNLLSDTAYLPDSELQRLYKEKNEKFNAMVAIAGKNAFMAKVGPITQAELKARYEKEKKTLETPEKRTLEYVEVAPAVLRKSIKITDAQVRAYYEDHIKDFSIPATERRASHILIKVAKDAKPAVVAAAKKKAEEIYKKAKAGEDFAKLAKEYSQGPTASRGGDLGWFGRQSMVKPFADAVFDQCKAVGDIVGPVRTQFGFHVIKLTGIGGQAKPFDEVKEQVRQTMLLSDPSYVKQAEKLEKDAEKALGEAKDDAAMKAAAKKFGLQVRDQMVPVSKTDAIGILGKDAKLSEAVFKAMPKQWSEPVTVKKNWVRFKVTKVIPAHPSTFEEARSGLMKEIRDEKASEMAEQAAKTLLKDARDAKALEAAAKKMGLQARQTGLQNAKGYVPGVGQDRDLNKALLAAGKGDRVGPVKVKTGWVVAYVTDHQAADMKKFEADKTSFAKSQRDQIASRIMQDYVAQRMKQLEKEKAIHYNMKLIKQMETAS